MKRSFDKFKVSFILGKTGDKKKDNTLFEENISNGHIPVAEIDENHPAVKYMAENEPNIRGGVVTINYTKEFKA